MRSLLRAIDSWWMAPAPAERLATLRLLIGCYALVHLATQVRQLWSFRHFDAAHFAPVGLATLLDRPLEPWALIVLITATLLGALPFALGYRFRFSGPLFAALLLALASYRSSWGMIFHTENLMALHVVLVGIAAAADAGSLDARRRTASAGTDARYGWPLRLVSLATTLTYLVSGIAKLRHGGGAWLSGDTLRYQIAQNNLRKNQLGVAHSVLGAWLVQHGWIFRAFAVLTLVFELGAPLALIGGWVALGWVVLAYSFHLGVLAVMAILFGYPLSGVAFASFFRVERLPLLPRILRWLSGGAHGQPA